MKKIWALVFASVVACVALVGCDSKPPTINGLDEESIEIMCGTDFNLNQYVLDHVEGVSDETNDGTKDYAIEDLEYTISCDEEIYDSETGAVDTGEFGDFPVTVSVKDEAGNEASKTFTLVLNPLDIQKGFYVYKQTYSDRFDLLGYCSIENRSRVAIDISAVEFQYLDKDGVTVTGTDMVQYAPEYLAGSRMGYGYDTFAGTNANLKSEDDVAEIEVSVDYSRAASENDNALEVGEITRINDYAYNVSHFAGEAVITNPFDKDIDYYTFLVGMYDTEGNLIGVMNSFDTTPIKADSKARVIAGWLPDSTARPDATVRMQGAASVQQFAQ